MKDKQRNDDLTIEIFGAREHNLKNLDLRIPKNKLVVFTGVSGSGKSSLAFDTIYNEGQRRYMESFSAYARQFLGDMERPDVDKITGLSPVISIEQKTTNKNPRSTVGTITEVYDFLRLLFARAGEAYSYNTGKKMVKFSEEEIVTNIFQKFNGRKVILLAPLVRGRKGHYRELFEEIRKKGFLKVRVDGEILDLTAKMRVDRYKIHDIEVVVDRLEVKEEMRVRLSQSVQESLKLGKDLMFVSSPASTEKPVKKNKDALDAGQETNAVYSRQLMCADTGISYEEPSPNSFSFNSPYGACSTCKGMGAVYSVDMDAVIPDNTKSIQDGGIVPLGEERDAYVYKNMAQVARKFKIKLDRPISELSETSLNLILFGNEDGGSTELDDVEDVPVGTPYYEYEGIVNMLKRWFSGANSSEAMRDWTEKYMELKTCPTCDGARLKKESLWFKIGERNIAALSELNLDELMEWFGDLEKRMSSKQNVIAKDVLKEIKKD